MAIQNYPKDRKLKRKTEIDLLFQQGKWRVYQNHRLIFLKTEEGAGFRIGVSVSKRNFKRAVDRNRIKRLLREVYRLNRPVFEDIFGPNVLVMIFYQGKQLPDSFAKFQQEWLAFLDKLKATLRPDNTFPETAGIPGPDGHFEKGDRPSAEP